MEMCCNNEDKLKMLQDKLNEVKAQYAEKVKPVEKCVSDHPIPSILVAAGAGILVGVLIGKYSRRE